MGEYIEKNISPDKKISLIETVYLQDDDIYVHITKNEAFWTQITLPEFDFMKYNWYFKRFFLIEDKMNIDDFPEYFMDLDSRASLKNEEKFLKYYKLKKLTEKKYFNDNNIFSKIFPRKIEQYIYSDLYLWEKIK